MDVADYLALGLDRSLWDLDPGFVVNGRSNSEIGESLDAPGDRDYLPCPEASPRDEVAPGTVLKLRDWDASAEYPDTLRDLWIHVPSGFEARGPAPGVVVFQDGGAYLDPQGPVRAATVLDNVNAEARSPALIGVFVNPGRPPPTGDRARDGLAAMRQRSVEYDSCNARYARFLSDEILPLVESQIGCAVSSDPTQRVVCGISSGGIAAFNAAWHAPHHFAGVLSHCGSFTNIRGGHNYPYLIRTTPRKPIRVVLQSGARDADILYGSWPLANQAMAAALAFAGYEHRFLFGEGGHSLRHGGSVFGETLRWLLAPNPGAPASATA